MAYKNIIYENVRVNDSNGGGCLLVDCCIDTRELTVSSQGNFTNLLMTDGANPWSLPNIAGTCGYYLAANGPNCCALWCSLPVSNVCSGDCCLFITPQPVANLNTGSGQQQSFLVSQQDCLCALWTYDPITMPYGIAYPQACCDGNCYVLAVGNCGGYNCAYLLPYNNNCAPNVCFDSVCCCLLISSAACCGDFAYLYCDGFSYTACLCFGPPPPSCIINNPGGSCCSVQYNYCGTYFGGDGYFTYDNNNCTLSVLYFCVNCCANVAYELFAQCAVCTGGCLYANGDICSNSCIRVYCGLDATGCVSAGGYFAVGSQGTDFSFIDCAGNTHCSCQGIMIS